MGETPEVVKIACPGCETQFRLKPKKGRLPAGPVPCPKCGESIPIVEENIRRDASKKPAAPQAHVFTKDSTADTKKIRDGTVGGSPSDTPHKSEAVTSEDDEFDHIAVSPGLTESNPKSTFLGMGSALKAVGGPGKRDDKTAVVDNDILAKIRSESSVVDDDDEDEQADEQVDELRQTSEQKDVFQRETSENKAVGPEDLARIKEERRKQAANKAKKAKQDPDDAPGQMVLGKIKIQKKLKRTLKQKIDPSKSAKPKAGARPPSKPAVSDDTTSGSKSTGGKPSLSSLLKKARQKKDKISVPRPGTDEKKADSTREMSTKNLDRALDDLADDTARSITEKSDTTDDAPPAFDSGDSSMIDMLRRRVAENQQPGAASERRGSGYIRLPTAEIQDVLGHGIYRLRVEDIVYEPIDKEGLTQLVKRGVLLGAEEIAEPDGDWMPVAEHPVFLELRRKMAHEAHDLLKQYKSTPDGAGKPDEPGKADVGGEAELPGRKNELPGRVDKRTAPSTDGIDDGELPAELEEEAVKAADELFADIDAEDDAGHAPPPMPAEDDASIELDYDALGVQEEDVEVSSPTPADQTGSLEARGSSMRTWFPLIAAAAVLAGIAIVAFSPVGRPYLDDILGKQTGGQTTDETPPDEGAANPAADDEGQPSADTKEAIAEASTTLAGALAVDLDDADLQQSVADELAKSGDFAGAARVMGVLWQKRSDDADFAANFADVLIKSGHFNRARQVAVDSLALDDDTHDFANVFTQAIEKNPALDGFDTVDISGELADAATLETEDKRVVLRLARDGEATFNFKPSQSGWERGWRRSIASYRLCQIMVCNFDIPRTRPARIDKATYDTLTQAADSASTEALDWVSEDGKKYVYGALQDAVEGPARFPIEAISLWRGWLSTGDATDLANVDVTKALDSLKDQPGGYYQPLVGQLGKTSLARLASQLSSVLVFDFLTNNWSRFNSDEAKWGTHLHLADGQLVSLHNGEAYQPRASTRIKGRFGWTSRFSRATIASLRLMTPKLVSEKLFPNASAGEKARLDVFWSQRDAVLERIDKLNSAHGDKEVLVFD